MMSKQVAVSAMGEASGDLVQPFRRRRCLRGV